MTATLTMSNYIFSTNTGVYSKLVYAAIKKFSNNEGKCFPARNTLAKLCKVSLSTLRKAINNLVEAKILEKEYRYRENRSQTSNLYTLTPFMMSGDYYFKVRADIFELDLSEKEIIVYMYFCSCSNKNNECYPSIKQIASACGICQTSVKSAIKVLIGRNLIIKANQFREDGGKRNNLYKIITEGTSIAESNIEQIPNIEDEAHEIDSALNEEQIISDISDIKTETSEMTKPEEEYCDIDCLSKKTEVKDQDVYIFEPDETEKNRKVKMRDNIFNFKLSKNSLMVYLYISTYAELKTGKFSSHEQIVRNCKISSSNVDKSIVELKNLGLIEEFEQGELSNTIVITEPPPWAI